VWYNTITKKEKENKKMKKFVTKITRGDAEVKCIVEAIDKDHAARRFFEILGEHGLQIKEL
jgi:hypothetical protein